MSRDWESIFSTWSKGPGKTEQNKAENAEHQIKQAILSSDKLRDRKIHVFTQGSYRNRVNVRKSSDVDIGVLCSDVYFSEHPDDNVKAELEKSSAPATYEYATFKNELEQALVDRFGKTEVTRGSKAFDIKANSYRVEADVVPFFEHRRYTSVEHYYSGVEMMPDDLSPPSIKNWPEQHYQNGVTKNDQTSRMYKRVVRILKSLSNEMSANRIQSAKDAPSFLVECLVFNASNSNFNDSAFKQIVRDLLAELFNNTLSDEKCSEWGEVNKLKYLFRASQPWTRHGAHQFLSDAWDYIGCK